MLRDIRPVAPLSKKISHAISFSLYVMAVETPNLCNTLLKISDKLMQAPRGLNIKSDPGINEMRINLQ